MYCFYMNICLGLVLSIKPALTVPTRNKYDVDEFFNDMILTHKTKFQKLMDKIVDNAVEKINVINQKGKTNQPEDLQQSVTINSNKVISTSSSMATLSFNVRNMRQNENSRYLNWRKETINSTPEDGKKSNNAQYDGSDNIVEVQYSTKVKNTMNYTGNSNEAHYKGKSYVKRNELISEKLARHIKTNKEKSVFREEKYTDKNNDKVESKINIVDKNDNITKRYTMKSNMDTASKERDEINYPHEISHKKYYANNNDHVSKELTRIIKINKSKDAEIAIKPDFREAVDDNITEGKNNGKKNKNQYKSKKYIETSHEIKYSKKFNTTDEIDYQEDASHEKYNTMKSVIVPKELKKSSQSKTLKDAKTVIKQHSREGTYKISTIDEFEREKNNIEKHTTDEYITSRLKTTTLEQDIDATQVRSKKKYSKKPYKKIVGKKYHVNRNAKDKSVEAKDADKSLETKNKKSMESIESYDKKLLTGNSSSKEFIEKDKINKLDVKDMTDPNSGIHTSDKRLKRLTTRKIDLTVEKSTNGKLNYSKKIKTKGAVQSPESQEKQTIEDLNLNKKNIENDKTKNVDLENTSVTRKVIHSDVTKCASIEKKEYRLMKKNFDRIDKIYKILKTFTKVPEINTTRNNKRKKSHRHKHYANNKFGSHKSKKINDEIEENNNNYLAKRIKNVVKLKKPLSCEESYVTRIIRDGRIELIKDESSIEIEENSEISENIAGHSNETSAAKSSKKYYKLSRDVEQHFYVYL
ncbi:GRIP and coiled-coil domain-containing protein-like [Plodia interpunctella]|uniref:GRIP and coiled-coil domain-containing protein-like n=1 Tax=Plodia interpunctella TaxID=58824 RepID=UPI002367CE45|nr:GRIP and coiled-coil domain-containing protein-like [Plodia interpunctella]